MKRIFFCIAAFCSMAVSFGQTLKRNDNESVEAFVKRMAPDSTEPTHPIISKTPWDTAGQVIVVFYGYHDTMNVNNHSIYGRIFFPLGKNSYRLISIQSIDEDGGYPDIISVFFANADKDKTKELVVLCRYDQRHYDYNGALYETFIFDAPNNNLWLAYLHDLSVKFWGCECDWREGKTEKAKYKTAANIKAGLRKMGF